MIFARPGDEHFQSRITAMCLRQASVVSISSGLCWSASVDGLVRIWNTTPLSGEQRLDNIRLRGWIQARFSGLRKFKKKWLVIESGRLQLFEDRVVGAEQYSVDFQDVDSVIHSGNKLMLQQNDTSFIETGSSSSPPQKNKTPPRSGFRSRLRAKLSRSSPKLSCPENTTKTLQLKAIDSKQKVDNVCLDKLMRSIALLQYSKAHMHQLYVDWLMEFRLKDEYIESFTNFGSLDSVWSFSNHCVLYEWKIDNSHDKTGLRPDLCTLLVNRRIQLQGDLSTGHDRFLALGFGRVCFPFEKQLYVLEKNALGAVNQLALKPFSITTEVPSKRKFSQICIVDCGEGQKCSRFTLWAFEKEENACYIWSLEDNVTFMQKIAKLKVPLEKVKKVMQPTFRKDQIWFIMESEIVTMRFEVDKKKFELAKKETTLISWKKQSIGQVVEKDGIVCVFSEKMLSCFSISNGE